VGSKRISRRLGGVATARLTRPSSAKSTSVAGWTISYCSSVPAVGKTGVNSTVPPTATWLFM
jgi:hypothetical protein